MTIDAINNEACDDLPCFDLPKAYLLPFPQIEAALRIDCQHLSKLSREFVQIAINPAFKQVTKCDEARPRRRNDLAKPQPANGHLFEGRVNIPPDFSSVERVLEERGFRFADNPYVNSRDFTYAHADDNQPEIILCKNIFKKAAKAAKKLVKKHISAAKHVRREIDKVEDKAVSWAKDHKTELIIGAVVVAAVAVAILAAPAAGAAAAAALPALDSDDEKKESSQKKAPSPKQETLPPSRVNLTSENGTSHPNDFFSPPATTSNYSPESTWTNLTPSASQNGIPAPGPALGEPLNFENYHYRPWENPFPQGVTPVFSQPEGYMPSPYAAPGTVPGAQLQANVTPSWYYGAVDPDGPPRAYGDVHSSPPASTSPHVFTTPGTQLEGRRIIVVNGIGNEQRDAQSLTLHLQKLSGGHEVRCVYSPTHTIPVDIVKAGVDLVGHAAQEVVTLQRELIQFHTENLTNPTAKCLLTPHSRGAIYTRQALEGLPYEVQQRVIVVAIAPAVIIPDHLCFDSFNYASKSDPIPQLFDTYVHSQLREGVIEAPERYLSMLEKEQGQLILLDPHPDDSLLGHGFQEPVFEKVLKHHLEKYMTGDNNMTPYGVDQ